MELKSASKSQKKNYFSENVVVAIAFLDVSYET
jgi:hypothetical protein